MTFHHFHDAVRLANLPEIVHQIKKKHHIHEQ